MSSCCEPNVTKALLGVGLASVLLPSALTVILHYWERKEMRAIIAGYVGGSFLLIGGALYAYDQYCKNWLRTHKCPT